MPARTGLGNRRKTGRTYKPAIAGPGPLVRPGRVKALARREAAARAAVVPGAPRPDGALGETVRRQSASSAGAGSQRGGGPGLGGSVQAGLGRQLSGRVSSGVIDQGRAEETAGERALLEQAYGPEWRTHVYGDRGYTQRTRKAMAANPDSKRARALYENLMQRRKEMLERAQIKVNGGTTAPGASAP
jgi:hypothetical protein